MTKPVKYPTAPLSSFCENAWNPNRMSEWMYQKEKNSIETFGFSVPVIVRPLKKTGKLEVIDGAHRLRAARDLGLKAIPYFNVGVVPDHVAKRMTVALNRLGGDDDSHKLAILLKEVEGEIGREDMLEALPFTDNEVDRMLATLEPPVEEDERDRPQGPRQVSITFLFSAQDAQSAEKALDDLAKKNGLDRPGALLLALKVKRGAR